MLRREWYSCLFLVFFACFTSLNAEVIKKNEKQQCAQQCSGVYSDLIYTPGVTYSYLVRSKFTFRTARNSWQADYSLNAVISAISACEFSLKIENVALQGIDSKAKQWIEAHFLHFAYDDGTIEVVCPDEKDPPWVQSFKRAILSLFQVSGDFATSEKDYLGECPLTRSKRNSGGSVVIETSKNLTSCQRRNDLSGIPYIPYDSNSNIKKPSILKANQKCTRNIKDSTLQSVSCMEIYDIGNDFVEGKGSIINLEIQQNMQFTDKTNNKIFVAVKTPQQPLIFNQLVGGFTVDELKSLVKSLCDQKDFVKEKTAMNFVRLINLLKLVDKNQIKQVSDMKCRIFQDALVTCGTRDCINIFVQLVQLKYISSSTYSSLALINKPQIEIINEIGEIIDLIPVEGLLGVSSLVNSYCLQNINCENERSVTKILNFISEMLGKQCNNPAKDEDRLILLLKSVGNIANEGISVNIISNCLSKATTPFNAKLVAIESLRKKDCDKISKSTIENIFFNTNENEELRIAVFRRLISCPQLYFERILNQLGNETNNQVGSYVWSFLNTAASSSNPSFTEIKKYLKKSNIPSQFNLDNKRFSRFSEFDSFKQQENIGGHIGSSVIFSSDSYLPRQIILNGSLHIFGDSINFFEIGVRAKNLDNAINELFGFDGYITNPNANIFRKRDFQIPIPKLRQIGNEFFRKSQLTGENLFANFHLRIFGNDLHYYNLQTDNYLESFKKIIDLNKFFAKDGFKQTTRFDKNIALLGVSYVLPTISGFPLRIGVDNCISMHLEYSLGAKLPSIAKSTKDAQSSFLTVSINPSIDLHLGAFVQMDIPSSTFMGKKFTTSVHLETNMLGDMQKKTSDTFSASLMLPEDDAALGTFMMNGDWGSEYFFGSDKKRSLCTSKTAAKITGLQACIEAERGVEDYHAAIRLKKDDLKLKKYEFVFDKTFTANRKKFLMRFDTPSTTIDRKWEVDFDVNGMKSLRMALSTPMKKISLEGSLAAAQKNSYTADLQLFIDNIKKYNLKGDIKFIWLKGQEMIDLKANSATRSQPITLSVQYSRDDNSLLLNFNLDEIFPKPLAFSVKTVKKNSIYSANLQYSEISDSSGKADLKLEMGPDVTLAVDGEYKYQQKSSHFNLQANHLLKGNLMSHSLKQTALVNIDSQPLINYKLEATRNKMEKKYLFYIQQDKSIISLEAAQDVKNLYTSRTLVKIQPLMFDREIDVSLENNYPRSGRLKAKTKNFGREIMSGVTQYEIMTTPNLRFFGNMTFSYGPEKIVFGHKTEEISKGKFKSTTSSEWKNMFTNIDSDIRLNHKENEYSLDTTIRSSAFRQPVILKKKFKKFGSSADLYSQVIHGAMIVYEVSIEKRGSSGKQSISLDAKSELPQIKAHYYLTSNFQETAEEYHINSNIEKDGKRLAKTNFAVSKTNRAMPRKISGQIEWQQANKIQRFSGKYIYADINGRGKQHNLTLESNDDSKIKMYFEKNDGLIMDIYLEKDRRMLFDISLNAERLQIEDFEINVKVDTAYDQWKKTIGKVALLLGKNKISSEIFLELNGRRYLLRADGELQQVHSGRSWIINDNTERHLTFALQAESPMAKIRLDKQLQLDRVSNVRNSQSKMQMDFARRSYSIENSFRIMPDDYWMMNKFVLDSKTFMHSLAYKRLHEKLLIENSLVIAKFEFNTTLAAERAASLKMEAKSTMPQLKYIMISYHCESNMCRMDNNINNKHKLIGHCKISPQLVDIYYLVVLEKIYNGEMELKAANIMSTGPKSLNGRLKDGKKIYEITLEQQSDNYIIKLRDATRNIIFTKVNVIQKGESGVQLMAKLINSPRSVELEFDTAVNRKLFRIQLLGGEEPFEVSLEAIPKDGKRSITALLIKDPLKTRNVYGIILFISPAGQNFDTSIRLQHPKRSIEFGITQPKANSISVFYQPNVGGTIKATRMNMELNSNRDGYIWRTTFEDRSLTYPLALTVRISKSETGLKRFVEFGHELDYSGEPSKLLQTSLKIVEHLSANKNIESVDAEFKATHPHSRTSYIANFNMALKEVNKLIVPVQLKIAATINNQRVNEKLKLDINSDGRSYAEANLVRQGTQYKARISRVKDDLKIELYNNNQNVSSIVITVNNGDNGFVIDVKNKELDTIIFHTSALMPTESLLKAKTWHIDSRKRIMDANLELKVDPENYLHILYFLRPELIARSAGKRTSRSGLENTTQRKKRTTMKDIRDSLIDSNKMIFNDLFGVLSRIYRSLHDTQMMILRDYQLDSGSATKEIDKLFEDNRRAILEAFDSTYKVIGEQISTQTALFGYSKNLMNALTVSAKDQLESISKNLKDIKIMANELQTYVSTSVDYIENQLQIKKMQANINGQWSKILKAAQEMEAKYGGLPKVSNTILKFIFKVLSKASKAAMDRMSIHFGDNYELIWSDVLNGLSNKDFTAVKNIWLQYIPEFKEKNDGKYHIKMLLPYKATTLREVLEPDPLKAARNFINEMFITKEYPPSHLGSIYTFENPLAKDQCSSIAYIVGDGHFITFDGRVFDLNPSCELLLASDLINYQFAITMSSSRGDKSFHFYHHGKQIAIYPKSMRVEVDMNPVNLPWQLLDVDVDSAILTSVIKKDDILKVSTYDGVQLICYDNYDLCLIVLPRHMYARSGGILGFNDNEPYNDHFLANGRMNNQTTNELVQYWTVKGQCRLNPPGSSVATENCRLHFEQSSLSKCFPKIHSRPFEDVCNDENYCTAAAAYSSVCSREDVELAMPSECVVCEQSLTAGIEKKIQKDREAFDVLFIIEENNMCLQSMNERLADITNRLIKKGVQFGWVGFGGEGIFKKPIIRYRGNASLYTGSYFLETLKQLSPNPVSTARSVTSDPLEAVIYAARKFPFRAAAAKTIILAACSKCSGSHKDAMTLLLAKGIKFHVLTDKIVSTIKKVKIAGYDAQALYAEDNRIIGEPSDLLGPTDSCTTLAQLTYGTVFNKDAFFVASSKYLVDTDHICDVCECTEKSLKIEKQCRVCEQRSPAIIG